jgi:hypothetical protein
MAAAAFSHDMEVKGVVSDTERARLWPWMCVPEDADSPIASSPKDPGTPEKDPGTPEEEKGVLQAAVSGAEKAAAMEWQSSEPMHMASGMTEEIMEDYVKFLEKLPESKRRQMMWKGTFHMTEVTMAMAVTVMHLVGYLMKNKGVIFTFTIVKKRLRKGKARKMPEAEAFKWAYGKGTFEIAYELLLMEEKGCDC